MVGDDRGHLVAGGGCETERGRSRWLSVVKIARMSCCAEVRDEGQLLRCCRDLAARRRRQSGEVVVAGECRFRMIAP